MNQLQSYLAPDYFPDFHCKMGACRAACCEGWPISFSLADYFKLLSVDCSAELRRKLDCAMHILEHPSPEAYAQISPRYDGQCPMRMTDGRCALHAELGEEVLADVCRLYPRGVRAGEVRECSCANSCEAVVELLLKRREKLHFVSIEAGFHVPQAPQRKFHFENAGREQEIRLWLIALLQNRDYSLPQRLSYLGEALGAMNRALKASDHALVERLLSGKETPPIPPSVPSEPQHLRLGLRVARRMLEIMDERSDSLRSYGEKALGYFGSEEAAYENYCAAKRHFAEMIPQWESWFENLLINHMFFAQFPFQDRPVDLIDEFIALCAVHMLLRFLCLGCLADEMESERAVDVVAAAFRLIDHTEFDRYAAPILKELCGDDKLTLLYTLQL